MIKILLLSISLLCVHPAYGQDQTKSLDRDQIRKVETATLIKLLPKEKAELINKAFETLKNEAKAENDKIKNLNQEMRDALSSSKFDKKNYLNAAQKAQQTRSEYHSARIKVIADTAEKLNEHERKVFIQLMILNMR